MLRPIHLKIFDNQLIFNPSCDPGIHQALDLIEIGDRLIQFMVERSKLL